MSEEQKAKTPTEEFVEWLKNKNYQVVLGEPKVRLDEVGRLLIGNPDISIQKKKK